MILYPAIDLKGGRVVRLLRGDMDKATVFNDDPADQARKFAAAGASWIHVVDLDGAFAGKPKNAAAVDAILKAVQAKIQLGGGIRDRASINAWLDRGVERVVLGTAAVKNPELVKQACKEFPGRVALGIDARQGKVAVEGWAESSSISALDLARQIRERGRGGHHLHRYRTRRRARRRQSGGHGGTGAVRQNPGDRLGRHSLARRHSIAQGEGHSGRDTGTGAL